jgi:hypothetical protein
MPGMADREVISGGPVRERELGLLERGRVQHSLLTVLLLAVSVVVFAAAGWPMVRTHLQAIAVLRMVAGQPVPWILGRVVANPIVKQDLSFEIPGETTSEPRTVRARLYLPMAGAEATQPALIVLHGVHYLGIDEPRLVHGEADNIIPAAETLWLERDLPRGTLKAALISPVLSHIDFESSNPTAMDEWRLTHFFALVMPAAELR